MFNRLNESDSLEMYNFLKDLKKRYWMIDISNIDIIDKILNFHFKITGLYTMYDGKNTLTQLSLMVKDMADYFKQDILVIKKRKCSQCKVSFPIEEFFSKTKCYKCRNNK